MELFNLEPEKPLSPRRRNTFAFMALTILIFAIYSNTFDASWHFDDRQNIQDKKALHMTELSWESITKTFFTAHKSGRLYRPVPCLSFALNYYFGKLNVFGFHLVNISIHVLSALFLYLFVFQLLRLPRLKSTYGSDAYVIALVSALLWALNPVQTQAVTYIVQRMAAMAAMFSIMAMFFWVKARTGGNRSLNIRYFAASGLCALLAFGSKENAAMLPFSILLLDLFLIQEINQQNLKKNVWILAGLVGIPLVLLLILKGTSLFSLDYLLSRYEVNRPFGLIERVLTEQRVILMYLSLLMYPIPQRLSLIHEISISRGLLDPPATIVSIIVIFIIVLGCVLSAKRVPLLAYCFLFFFLNHIIEGSVFCLELFFEHRNYLPSMLLFVPVSILMIKGIRYYGSRPAMQVILCGFLILILMGMGNMTYLRNHVWKTDYTLWSDAVKKAPNVIRPHLNLGNYLLTEKLYDKALERYSEGARKRPGNNMADSGLIYYNIGLVYQRKGDQDTAFEFYQKSADAYPNHADTHNNLGLILYEKGDKERADFEVRQAIRYEKNHIKAHRNLALFALKDGDLKKAFFWINKALPLAPDNVVVLGAAGYCYRLKGLFGGAFGLLEKALQHKNYDPKLDLYMAEIFFKRNMHEQAILHVEKFAGQAKDNDVLGYVKGTYKDENRLEMILPYKKLVLFALSKAYENNAAYLNDKAAFVRESMDDLQME